MSDLPAGWEWATIGEVADVNPTMSKGDIPDDQAVSFVPMSAVSEESGKVDYSDRRSAGGLKSKSYRQFTDGDLLVAKITPSMENGKAAVARGLVNGRGFGSTEFHVVRAAPGVSPEYLLHFVLQRRFRADAARSMTGTAGQLRVPPDYLRSRTLPLPPTQEQQRVVAAIEERLSRLDAAESAMASARTRLVQLRASVLEHVTAGGWAVRSLGDVLLSLRNGCFVSRPKADPPGLPILRISAVRPLALDPSAIRYAPGDFERSTVYRVETGDLLFTRYSGNPDYVGACAVVPSAAAGYLHPDKLIRGVPDPCLVLSDWVALVVSSGRGRREIEQRLKTTAGQVGISGSQLKTVPIPLPPLSTQSERIAAWLTSASAMSRLQRELNVASARAVAARRSILAAAFSGQLLAQRPDDEPAAILLERIRSERSVGTKGKRARKGIAS